MTVPPRVRLLLLAIVFAVAPLDAQQTQAPVPFEPSVGQAGKDVVWVPTPPALVDAMLDLAKVTPADFLVDLGSGDGVTVITAAKRGVRALGIEYDPRMVALARDNAEKALVASRASFRQADLFATDFSDATVLTMFLLPSINLALRPTILKMKPGTRVVTNTFTMGEWEPDEQRTISPCDRWCTALLWIVPAQVAGTWRLGGESLVLTQKFQVVSGMLGSKPLIAGRLHAEDIRFEVGGTRYEGRVEGQRMRGTATTGANRVEWTAALQP